MSKYLESVFTVRWKENETENTGKCHKLYLFLSQSIWSFGRHPWQTLLADML